MDFMNFQNITTSPIPIQQPQPQQPQQQQHHHHHNQPSNQFHDQHLGQSYTDFFQSTSITKITPGITENPNLTSNYTYNNKSSADSNSTNSHISPLNALPGSTMSFIAEDNNSLTTTPLDPIIFDQKEESQHDASLFQNNNNNSNHNNISINHNGNNINNSNNSNNTSNYIGSANDYPNFQNAAYGSSSTRQQILSQQTDSIYDKQEHYPYNPILLSSENSNLQSSISHAVVDNQDIYYEESSYPVPSCQDGFQSIYEQSQWLKQKFPENEQSSFPKNSNLMDSNNNQTFLYSTNQQESQQVNSIPFQIQLENFQQDQNNENKHQHEAQSQPKIYFDNHLVDTNSNWQDNNPNITSFPHSNINSNGSFTDIAHFQTVAETSNSSLENNNYAFTRNEDVSDQQQIQRHHNNNHHRQPQQQQQQNLIHNGNLGLSFKIGINSDGIGMNSGIDFKDPVISKLLKSRRRKKKNDYRCSHCNTLFPNIMSFMEHMDQYKLIKFQSPPTPPPIECDSTVKVGDDILNVCNFHNCRKMFKRKDSLRRHARLVHENKNSRFNQRLRIQRIILEEQQ